MSRQPVGDASVGSASYETGDYSDDGEGSDDLPPLVDNKSHDGRENDDDDNDGDGDSQQHEEDDDEASQATEQAGSAAAVSGRAQEKVSTTVGRGEDHDSENSFEQDNSFEQLPFEFRADDEEDDQVNDQVAAVDPGNETDDSDYDETEREEEEDTFDAAAPAAATWNFMAGFTRDADSDSDDDHDNNNNNAAAEQAQQPQYDAFGNRFGSDDGMSSSEAPTSGRFSLAGKSDSMSMDDDSFMDEDLLAQQQQRTILKERQQRKLEADEAQDEIDFLRSRALFLCYLMIGLVVIFVIVIVLLYLFVWKDNGGNDGTTEFIKVQDNVDYPLRHLPDYTQFAIETDPASPQALAYTWMNNDLQSGDDDGKNYTVSQSNNRFALVTLYFAMGGVSWDDNKHWLSHNTECVWNGYQCGALRQREKEQAREQGLTGNEGVFSSLSNGGSPGAAASSLSKSNGGGRGRYNLRRNLQITPGWILPSPVTPFPTDAPLQETPEEGGLSLNLGGGDGSDTDGDRVDEETEEATDETEEVTHETTDDEETEEGDEEVFSTPEKEDTENETGAQEATTDEVVTTTDSNNGVTEMAPHDDAGDSDQTPISMIRDEDPILTVVESDESLVLKDNGLIGTIPPELSLLTSTLYLLALNNNPGLIGKVPKEIASLSGLRNIQISRNGITGGIPKELSKLSNSLEALYLHRNKMGGSLPSELALLTNLQALWLHGNEFEGTIPLELFAVASTKDNPQMQDVEELFLDHNKLSGSIPDPLNFERDGEDVENSAGMGLFAADLQATYSALGSVKTLTLDNNQLTGFIPTSFGLFYDMETLTLHNNSLVGNVPREVCALFQLGKLKRVTIDCHKVRCDCQCECVTDDTAPVDTRPFYDTSSPDAAPSGPVFESLPAESQENILEDSSSPQAMAWNWLYNDPNAGEMSPSSTVTLSRTADDDGRLRRLLQHEIRQDHRMTLSALEREQQKFALATLFFATDGESWDKNRYWLSYEKPECEW